MKIFNFPKISKIFFKKIDFFHEISWKYIKKLRVDLISGGPYMFNIGPYKRVLLYLSFCLLYQKSFKSVDHWRKNGGKKNIIFIFLILSWLALTLFLYQLFHSWFFWLFSLTVFSHYSLLIILVKPLFIFCASIFIFQHQHSSFKTV